MSNNALMFVRNVGDKTILVAVVDTEAVSHLKNESQHFVRIGKVGDEITTVSILNDQAIDRSKISVGNSIGGLLISPIWAN